MLVLLSRFVSNTYHFWNNGVSALSFDEVTNVSLPNHQVIRFSREVVRFAWNRLGCGLCGSKSLPSLFSPQTLGGKKARVILSFPLFLCLFSSKDGLDFKLIKVAIKILLFMHLHFEEF